MPLEVHHLHLAQSERIVWLLEEMQVEYVLTVHERDPKTALSPPSLKAVSPTGTAPYMRDTSVEPPVSLSETGAIVQYILEVYGPSAKGTRMNRSPGDKDYGSFLSWLHFANGSLQPNLSRAMSFALADAQGTPAAKRFRQRLAAQLELIDSQLSTNKFLAGDEVTAADAMTLFSLTTMRGFSPVSLEPFKNILRYLQDVAQRPAYKEAIRKGDRGMEPMIRPVERTFVQFESFKPALDRLADCL